jgi:hypothetical protein
MIHLGKLFAACLQPQAIGGFVLGVENGKNTYHKYDVELTLIEN